MPKTIKQTREASDARSTHDDAVFCKELLSGVRGLTNPAYRKINIADGRNDRLLHAVLCAYTKHHLEMDIVGWVRLGEILMNAICNEIGDDEFKAWLNRMDAQNYAKHF